MVGTLCITSNAWANSRSHRQCKNKQHLKTSKIFTRQLKWLLPRVSVNTATLIQKYKNILFLQFENLVCKEQWILVYFSLVFIRITSLTNFCCKAVFLVLMFFNFAGFMLQRLLLVCFSCTEKESSTGG